MKLTQAVHKYRQGHGWIVVEWSPKYRAWDTSQEMDYGHACEAVRERREVLRKTGEYKKWL